MPHDLHMKQRGGMLMSTSEKIRELARMDVAVADSNLKLDRKLSSEVGVYAFVKEGIALYVGVATMGLAKRLYSYTKPGKTQLTNVRVNGLIKKVLSTDSSIEIYTAMPNDLEWNGLPVHGSAGLELGIIKKFDLPWNTRSSE